MTICLLLKFSSPYIFATLRWRLIIFQIINSVKSYGYPSKYQRLDNQVANNTILELLELKNSKKKIKQILF